MLARAALQKSVQRPKLCDLVIHAGKCLPGGHFLTLVAEVVLSSTDRDSGKQLWLEDTGIVQGGEQQ